MARQLFFGLDGSGFTLTGKLHSAGGGRLRAWIAEVRVDCDFDADRLVAIQIGLLSLSVRARDYFGGQSEFIRFEQVGAYPFLGQAMPALLKNGGWLVQKNIQVGASGDAWRLSDAPLPLEGLNVAAFTGAYFDGTLRALTALKAGRHFRDLFVLLQCSIDHLAWLARPDGQEDVTCIDFCRWVYQYLRLAGTGSLTAGEVYHWRCLWVHTYGGQLKATYGELALVDRNEEDFHLDGQTTILGVENLFLQYQAAIAAFATHCSLDPNLRGVVNRRLEELPQVQALSA